MFEHMTTLKLPRGRFPKMPRSRRCGPSTDICFVYVLCAPQPIYVGRSVTPRVRLREHQAGCGSMTKRQHLHSLAAGHPLQMVIVEVCPQERASQAEQRWFSLVAAESGCRLANSIRVVAP